MPRFTLRNVGYDANNRGEYPAETITADTFSDAVASLLDCDSCHTRRINDQSSIYAVYVRAPRQPDTWNKVGCVEHIRTEQ